MPIKPQLVLRQLGSLRRHIELLRPLQTQPLAELSRDRLRWYGLLYVLQMLVEHVTDISNHLPAGTNEVVTDDGRETILTMGQSGRLPLDFAERIAPMVGFRNVVVHEYLTVDPGDRISGAPNRPGRVRSACALYRRLFTPRGPSPSGIEPTA